jgi:hypothetical protein
MGNNNLLEGLKNSHHPLQVATSRKIMPLLYSSCQKISRLDKNKSTITAALCLLIYSTYVFKKYKFLEGNIPRKSILLLRLSSAV